MDKHLLILILIVGSAMAFCLCRRMAFKEGRGAEQCLFSDDEVFLLHRVDNLFEEAQLHNGHEWKSLPVDNLITMCVDASEIIAKDDSRRKKAFLTQTAERAENLSSWMKANEHRDFYKGSDMSYLIEKPRILAFSLRSKAGKISPTSRE